MILLGAIGGDIAGSRFEFNNYRAKDFELFSKKCFFTDDTVMTAAVARAILDAKPDWSDLTQKTTEYMQEFGREFPGRGYGGNFGQWLHERHPRPYNSFGNGSAMRASACGWAATSVEEARDLAEKVSAPTHNHPEGIKGAQATAEAIYLARIGKDKNEIRSAMEKYYTLDFTLDEIRDTYRFNETCQETVPQALEAFFESESYEDCLRCAVSVGGDSDTLAAIAGSIAEAYYGIPEEMQKTILSYLSAPQDKALIETITAFSDRYGKEAR